jgi:uncharacterized protein DUF4258
MIDQLRSKALESLFEFSKHAVDQTILRHIRVEELQEAIANGEIIEDYPEDKYGPSCLILGLTRAGRPLHIQLQLSLTRVGKDHSGVRTAPCALG